MRVLNPVRKFLRLFQVRNKAAKTGREYLLLYILDTAKFKKMPLQEKITTVARLVAIFEKDYCQVPAILSRKLTRLNQELHQSLIKSFQ